jgi:hypothetical protein
VGGGPRVAVAVVVMVFVPTLVPVVGDVPVPVDVPVFVPTDVPLPVWEVVAVVVMVIVTVLVPVALPVAEVPPLPVLPPVPWLPALLPPEAATLVCVSVAVLSFFELAHALTIARATSTVFRATFCLTVFSGVAFGGVQVEHESARIWEARNFGPF